jgi:hypothetical protein
MSDDIGTLRWFGESWHAPVNDPRARIKTPIDERCLECLLYIKSDDQGVRIPAGESHRYATFHKKCFFETMGLSDE